MAVTRRTLLMGSGGALVAIGGGLAGRAWQTGLLGFGDGPTELWRAWRTQPWPMPVVAAGVLAASPHNSQPWRFTIGDGAIELALDERQALGPVDPFLRQMWLGAGCAIENMAVAGAGLGRAVAVTVLRDPAQPSSVARVSFAGTAAPRPELLKRIELRHTNRHRYHRERRLAASIVGELTGSTDDQTRVDLFDRDEPRGRRFVDAIVDATRALIADAELIGASDRWFRSTPRDEAEHRDGPSLRCSGLPGWKRVVAGLAPRLSDRKTHEAWLAMTIERQCGTAPMFGALSVRNPDDPTALVAAGRRWQGLQLAATAHGLGMQPLDQLLELDDRERQLDRARTASPRLAELTDAGWRPVMTFRIGWPEEPAPASARRPLASFVAANGIPPRSDQP